MHAITELVRDYPENPLPLFVTGPNGCVGIKVDHTFPALKSAQRRTGLARIVNQRAPKIPVYRFSGTRIDLPFVFGRNMDETPPLFGRKIALIGCGTIGSHLAKFLVQSGAAHEGGTLQLLDNQTLEPGNVGRHYLGFPNVGEGKSSALKRELKRIFPDANILSFSTDATQHLPHLTEYDLVVDATGEESLSMSINHYFVSLRRDKKAAPSVLHTWLFGNGAAAQTLLVDDSDFACLKCLKPDHHRDWRFSPIKPNEAAELTPAACGESQFVPYGVAAPAIAAALALQLVLDWNKGRPEPRLRTINVEKTGIKQITDKNPSRSPHCPACGNA